MSNEFKLTVEKRNLLNKGGRKRSLKDGVIPGVYYSHDSKESIPFSISKKRNIWINFIAFFFIVFYYYYRL